MLQKNGFNDIIPYLKFLKELLLYTAKIINFFEHKRLVSGICLEEKGSRLRILCEDGKNVKLGINRVVHMASFCVDLKAPAEELLEGLRQRNRFQEELVKHVCAEKLWKVVDGRGQIYDAGALSGVVFGGKSDFDHEIAVISALMQDRVFFKLQGSGFLANTPEQVEKNKIRIEKEQQRLKLIEEGILWLISVRDGKEVPCRCRDKFIELLKNYAVFGTDAPDYGMTKEIFKKAGISDQRKSFDILVMLGVLDEDENLLLERYRVSHVWPESVSEQVNGLEETGVLQFAGDKMRKDLTGLKVFSIDDIFTRDIDDAISVEYQDDFVMLGIHVTDASSFILPGSPLDKEAARRGASLYLPEGKIPMIPQAVSENLLSLKEGEEKPAVSFLVKLSRSGEMLDYKAVLSVVKVAEKLTYEKVDKNIEQGSFFSRVYNTACGLREKRIASGASGDLIPELQVMVDHDKKIHFKIRDKESPSQVLVSEFMILANYCAALLFKENCFPSLFRKQAKSAEGIQRETNPSLFHLFSRRKFFSRVEVDVDPGPHSSLGLSSYTSITSPLRKYLDLAAQRQLVCLLRGDPPAYGRKELKDIVSSVQPVLTRVAITEQERKRYWILKVLKNREGERLNALVLDMRFRGCKVLLLDYLIDIYIKVRERIEISPGDTVSVIIDNADPFAGTLKVSLV